MCCLLTWFSDPQKEKNNAKQSWVCNFIHYFDATNILSSSNQIFCREPPNAQPNLPTNASTVSDRNNCEIVFPFGPYVKFILMVILDFRFSEKKDNL